MVTAASRSVLPVLVKELGEPPFKWTSVSLREVISGNHRLKASVYGIEGRQARKVIDQCRWPSANLCGHPNSGLAISYHRPRFKRIYLDKPGLPFFLPSQINDLNPKPTKYISEATETDIDALRVRKSQVLLTCSGTIGHCTYVRNTLDGLIFSHDIIRIEPVEHSGYIYAFLKSKIGLGIINTNNYGAVIGHIEPEHLNQVRIPDPPSALKLQIHKLVEKSFRLRDESNDLIEEAQKLLRDALELPDMEEMEAQTARFDKNAEMLNFSVPLGDLENRLDASYYAPMVDVLEEHFKQKGIELTKIGDSRISQSIILPGRFARVYVEEGNGVVFFGGKQLLQLDPTNKKFLAKKLHGDRIQRELSLRKNMTLISRSGTIGKVNIVPEHWEGWVVNEHVIRVVPAHEDIAGYLYAWLSSEFASPLISRYVYGSTVDEINDSHVSEISIPLLRSHNILSEVNGRVLTANEMRVQAYRLEKEALKVLNEKVFFAK